ncbi:ArsR/SmtB family transcription factor, partial [Streptomyces albidochromogenes]|uniref:ArsR/SmtB family transcription factor n=1 Tax=Streptomyces albidochromogenes TaxID=329524 RepID=UPI003F6DED1B
PTGAALRVPHRPPPRRLPQQPQPVQPHEHSRPLATPSRLMILTRLRQSPCGVTELAEAVRMEQSAVSHQLRLPRALSLVTGVRQGHRIVYSLYDNHVAQLLDEAVYHIEHLRLDARDVPSKERPDTAGEPSS